MFKHDKDKKNNITLCYPDTYNIGMPNLGIQALFRLINKRDDFCAGRCYMPTQELWKDIINDGISLYDWDTLNKLKKSNIISFTLSFEDQHLNLIRMLLFSGINPIATKRGDDDPIILAGGPCSSYNPEPLADFVDAFIIGEGENIINEILDIYSRTKNKKEFIREIDKFEYVYVPSRYEFTFNHDKIVNIKKNGKDKVFKNYVEDINLIPVHSSIMNKETVYNEEVFSIEVSRGCRMHCRFCYMGNHFKRPRSLTIEKLEEVIYQGLNYTKTIKLFFEALPKDYSKQLFDMLINLIDKEGIKLKLGSFRAEYLTDDIINTVVNGSQDSIILAPETSMGDQRDFINKGQITDAEIIEKVESCARYGIKNFGLYLIIGFNREKNSHLDSIIDLAEQVLKKMKEFDHTRTLELHINPFFPKPMTPLQFERNITQEEAINKLNYIKKSLKSRLSEEDFSRIVIKTIIHNDITFSQPLISRGDRRLGKVMLDLTTRTYPFTNNNISVEEWKKSLEKEELKPEFFYREREIDEILPWDIIYTNMDRNYFIKERNKAYKHILTPPCQNKSCKSCNYCKC